MCMVKCSTQFKAIMSLFPEPMRSKVKSGGEIEHDWSKYQTDIAESRTWSSVMLVRGINVTLQIIGIAYLLKYWHQLKTE